MFIWDPPQAIMGLGLESRRERQIRWHGNAAAPGRRRGGRFGWTRRGGSHLRHLQLSLPRPVSVLSVLSVGEGLQSTTGTPREASKGLCLPHPACTSIVPAVAG